MTALEPCFRRKSDIGKLDPREEPSGMWSAQEGTMVTQQQKRTEREQVWDPSEAVQEALDVGGKWEEETEDGGRRGTGWFAFVFSCLPGPSVYSRLSLQS